MSDEEGISEVFSPIPKICLQHDLDLYTCMHASMHTYIHTYRISTTPLFEYLQHTIYIQFKCSDLFLPATRVMMIGVALTEFTTAGFSNLALCTASAAVSACQFNSVFTLVCYDMTSQ